MKIIFDIYYLLPEEEPPDDRPDDPDDPEDPEYEPPDPNPEDPPPLYDEEDLLLLYEGDEYEELLPELLRDGTEYLGAL